MRLLVVALLALGSVSPGVVRPAAAQVKPSAEGAETPPAEETPPAGESAAAGADAALAALDAEKARLDKQTEVLKSRKALREAQAQAAQSALGPLGSYTGANGTVSVDEGNRSVLEATLLSAVAVDAAADQMGSRLCWILSGTDCDAPGFVARGAGPASPVPGLPPPDGMTRWALCREVRLVTPLAPSPGGGRPRRGHRRAVDRLADRPRRQLHGAHRRARPRVLLSLGEVKGGSLAAAGAIVSTIANLFRTDYTVYGIAVSSDQTLLTKGVALAFLRRRVPNRVYLPDLSPVSTLDLANPAIRRLAVLDALRAMAAGSRVQSSRGRLDAVIKAYDDALAALTTGTDGKPPLLAAIARQAGTAELVRSGALLVVTNVHMMGGTAYTKKNFFTFLGGMPYFVSGGALASYVVQDGSAGPVLDTLAVPITSGFHRANQLERVVPRARPRRR